MSGTIEIQDLSVRVDGPDGERRVLDGVSLSIAAGESVAVVGRSGSGKTTLLNVVGGLEPAFRGEVRLGGEDVWRRPKAARAAFRNTAIGFVFQDANLIRGLTALENLMIPLLLRGTAARRDRPLELLEELGLGERHDTRVERLSGGERQRVAAARALVAEPTYLFADEPTGNLDGENAARILDALAGYQRASGATMLIATHDSRVLARVENQVELRAGVLTGSAA